MGNLCGDSATKNINRRIDQFGRVDEALIKLLFLGAGGSGKSTLFRQLRLLHGNGLQDAERMNYRNNIYNNLVVGMKTLLEGNATLGGENESDSTEAKNPSIESCNEELAEYIYGLETEAPISKETADFFKKAWDDKGMQQTWEERSKFQLEDSLKYFIKHIDRIAEKEYCPSKDDVMHVRIQTTGIVEESLTMENRPFLVVDVGGQRSERRKWMNCFSGVTGLIFVASLVAYNQTLYEDETVNRLNESLSVFTKLLTKDDTFKEACVVLFLNKSDLFTEMIKETPISTCIQGYTGGDDEEAQYNYIKSLYEKKVKKKVFTHRTCATNTDQIKVIFDAVNQTVIRRALIKAGLLSAPR